MQVHAKSAPLELTAGRIVCDTRIAAQEFVHGARSYDLSSLVNQMLNERRDELRADEVLPAYEYVCSLCFWLRERILIQRSSLSLLRVCDSAVRDALYSVRLLHVMSALPLTVCITNTVGGVLVSCNAFFAKETLSQ